MATTVLPIDCVPVMPAANKAFRPTHERESRQIKKERHNRVSPFYLKPIA